MDARPLSWQDLQYFLAAARGGTLAAAAASLQVSAATVQRRLVQLEKTLDTRLFMRSQRGYALTPDGSELLENVLAIDAEVHTATRRIDGRDQSLAGTIRVSTVDDVMLLLLGPVLRGFADRRPDVCIEVSVDSAYADLARQQADVAVRPGLQPAAGDVVARRVCGVGVAMYGSRAYLQRNGMPASPRDLRGHRIVRADASHAWLPMERLIDRTAAPGSSAFRSASMLARLCAVRHGLGIGLLPCFAADAEPELVRIGDVLPEASAALWILVHRDLRRNARVRAFIDHVHAELTKLKRGIEGR